MGIGKRLYPPDEISARAPHRSTPQLDQAQVKFLGECRWNERLPLAWQQEHDRSLRATALASQADLPVMIRNRPVPRSANCHYDSALDSGPSTIYFY